MFSTTFWENNETKKENHFVFLFPTNIHLSWFSVEILGDVSLHLLFISSTDCGSDLKWTLADLEHKPSLQALSTSSNSSGE